MKIKFKETKLSKKKMGMLLQINSILEDYAEQGYILTLRQLYYRLVSKNIIPNKVSEYNKLSIILTDGRYSGIVDWDSIEDRIRRPKGVYSVDNIEEAIDDTINSYRLRRQAGQPNYVELWVEKDAISNILLKKTQHYGINLMVNRGYSSTTAMYDAYVRIERAIRNGQTPYILYLGDHDPSGLDMSLNDIPNRLNESFNTEVVVKHIGITMEHVNEFNPPPNPAKISDPRAKWYISEYGNSSWEVDALEPETLHSIIASEVEGLMDMELFNQILERESRDKKEIKRLPLIKSKNEEALRQLNFRIEHLEGLDSDNIVSIKNKVKVALKELKSIRELIK